MHSYKTLKSKDTFKYENKENLARNEQSYPFNDNLGNISEKINEVSDKQTNRVYSVLENHMTLSECGSSQFHIRVDFTPVAGADDDELLRQKCLDFWKFVDNHPKLQSFKAKEINEVCADEGITDESCMEGGLQEVKVPAVRLLQRPGIPQSALATKLKYTHCDHSDEDYSLMTTRGDKRPLQLKKRSNYSELLHAGLKSRSSVKNKSSVPLLRGLDDVTKVCSDMEQWDSSHPKSMAPPQRVPSLKILK